MTNDRNSQQASEPAEQQNKGREQTSKNPFKETSAPEPAETPQEEAAAEQQRKETLTERD
ncbi:MAG: hypothetical protein ACO1NX_01250 [Chitinophagaceae bacterium]